MSSEANVTFRHYFSIRSTRLSVRTHAEKRLFILAFKYNLKIMSYFDLYNGNFDSFMLSSCSEDKVKDNNINTYRIVLTA